MPPLLLGNRWNEDQNLKGVLQKSGQPVGGCLKPHLGWLMYNNKNCQLLQEKKGEKGKKRKKKGKLEKKPCRKERGWVGSCRLIGLCPKQFVGIRDVPCVKFDELSMF